MLKKHEINMSIKCVINNQMAKNHMLKIHPGIKQGVVWKIHIYYIVIIVSFPASYRNHFCHIQNGTCIQCKPGWIGMYCDVGILISNFFVKNFLRKRFSEKKQAYRHTNRHEYGMH